MKPERWQEVKKVLEVALEREPSEREAYLNEACAEPSVRREVQSLIAAHEHAHSSFLSSPADFPKEPVVGDRLGSYEILARIGAGWDGRSLSRRGHPAGPRGGAKDSAAGDGRAIRSGWRASNAKRARLPPSITRTL